MEQLIHQGHFQQFVGNQARTSYLYILKTIRTFHMYINIHFIRTSIILSAVMATDRQASAAVMGAIAAQAMSTSRAPVEAVNKVISNASN